MPVEILELNVRAHVQENANCGTTAQQSANINNAMNNNNTQSANSGSLSIIEECVSRVAEMLRHSNER